MQPPELSLSAKLPTSNAAEVACVLMQIHMVPGMHAKTNGQRDEGDEHLSVSFKQGLQAPLLLLLNKEGLLCALPAAEAAVMASCDYEISQGGHHYCPNLRLMTWQLQQQLELVHIPVLDKPVLACTTAHMITSRLKPEQPLYKVAHALYG